ncbi:MAG TPA: hypothetical protein V6D34_16685, partial [Candidatus Sericytochromatia bacterium]
RITWDYWDAAHLWNLALEAWSDGTLVVYSTREVQPSDFTEMQSSNRAALAPGQSFSSSLTSDHRKARSREFVIAWIVTIVGFVLMLSGI